MMTVKELREKNTDILQKELNELLQELFKLRMQKGVGQATRPHLFKNAKRQVARIKTILNEKARAA
jgi:large subunit ribosomal protein L29